MCDIKCCLLLMIFILLICLTCLVCTQDLDDEILNNGRYSKSIIIIDNDTYQKMLDAVTDYSLKTTDYNGKLTLIYLSTFHLFDMNYEYKDVKMLDDSLVNYPYYSNHVEFPVGNMHNNIQKAIITHISKNIDSSERQLSHNKEIDRQIIDIYLKDLFKCIDVIKQSN